MRKWMLALCGSAMAMAQGPEGFFEKNVRPLFIAKCNGCHGGANPAGGLSLLTREALLKGGSRGPSVVAGNPAGSLLMKAVMHTAGTLRMPPGPKLTDAELANLTQWINQGAVWGSSAVKDAKAETAKYWSFVAPLAAKPPAAGAWAKNPIDAFVLAKLQEKGLKPAAPADKRTLIRRATYDLTGMPPTPEEVKVFLADDSPRAFEDVVERLLASPRYGERWGRHWLDVARYADSNGLDENLVYKNAFRYRDYVIQAFNKDKPYDRFVQEQLAGDLLPDTGDLKTTFERWTATGFLSLGAKMLAEDDPVKMEVDIIDEQIDTLGKTFLGLTLGCARCHDHKFDPIPQADYYSLAGIFKSTKTMENFKVVAKWHEHVLAPKEDRDRLDAHLAKIEAKNKEIGKITRGENEKLTRAAKQKVGAYLLAAHEVRETPALQPLPADARVLIERDASSFDNGNAAKPVEPKKPNVPKGAKGPFYAEYKVTVEAAGDYQVELRDEERGAGTADLSIGGVLVKKGEGAVQNREASPDAGGWAPLGIFRLAQGENVLRLQHKNRFPYFSRMRIAASPLAAGKAAPRTLVQIARHYDINPSILEQMVEHLERSNGAAASVLYAFENFGKQRPAGEWTSPAAKLLEGFTGGTRQALADRYQTLFGEVAESAPEGDDARKALRELLTEKFGPFRAPDDAREYYAPSALNDLARLEEERKTLEQATPEFPQAMGVRDGDKITDLPIHLRGSHINLGQMVPRRFPRALAGENQPPLGPNTSGRLQLAQWLTGKDHPLTARVMVNRIWRWHFGRGIVPSTDNFGRLGEKPVNQPLLDWLAVRFVEQGWSIKAMHRLIMASNTYRMSSTYDERSFETDPENTLQWRFNRKRLEAESVRDAIVTVSGGMHLVDGGSILTYKDRQYVANTSKRGGVDYDRPIRAVYLPVVRSSMYELFTAFDLPDPSVPQGDRNASVIAPQALFMMNGSVVLQHTRKLAERLLAMPLTEDGARVREAYELALSRPASGPEVDQALTFLKRIEKELPAEAKDRTLLQWQSFCKALLASNEFIYIN
ncbi:MAG: DUF1549 domain-containing protein [Bryobacterales bacterium]|nr:DUF1549 domain-containing protein [Bryobacterales bacterium]